MAQNLFLNWLTKEEGVEKGCSKKNCFIVSFVWRNNLCEWIKPSNPPTHESREASLELTNTSIRETADLVVKSEEPYKRNKLTFSCFEILEPLTKRTLPSQHVVKYRKGDKTISLKTIFFFSWEFHCKADSFSFVYQGWRVTDCPLFPIAWAYKQGPQT